MTQKVLFRNQVSQRSGVQSKLATLASQPACNPSWLAGETVGRTGLVFHAGSLGGSLLTWNKAHSPSSKFSIQVHKNKIEGYSVSLHGSKQIADSCLCPRSDYRHRFCQNRVERGCIG